MLNASVVNSQNASQIIDAVNLTGRLSDVSSRCGGDMAQRIANCTSNISGSGCLRQVIRLIGQCGLTEADLKQARQTILDELIAGPLPPNSPPPLVGVEPLFLVSFGGFRVELTETSAIVALVGSSAVGLLVFATCIRCCCKTNRLVPEADAPRSETRERRLTATAQASTQTDFATTVRETTFKIETSSSGVFEGQTAAGSHFKLQLGRESETPMGLPVA